MDQDKEITIADLYPELTPEQQKEAEYRLLRYLAVVRSIFEELPPHGKVRKELDRRAAERRRRMKREGLQ